ncbi:MULTISPECIES: NupC/NupG family nucleoside CNT transporter [Acinetobacter]|uniref:NupC/NupG family nucleoside CNT transporter n=1 Tax=Acinetobacter TaxID=469 RepID=UPI0018A2DF56|nr:MULTISPECIES: NupC/NupG family nucleoside CNT transporter [Acinetobacter]MBF7690334.1 NupC/NupG family nucleoside CNT transporter [Acinetobacter pollinis]MBF7692839.1 NupC/NupG family nucleoside CNT transporter [Acinetobacter pollinis]MBF7697810.1 NupC/NupG family nucleoside CNT transporter [Acinetobacter pollinis]MBF7700582.1 NupC/NupG family nucleoside CNT transporter [Acinetobacter pollinis]WEV49845.1 NupC/NupG family nucleoside CNT transporter [Acinetobacter sp. ESL0695]
MSEYRGLIGILILLLIGFIFSNNRRMIKIRTILPALGLQFALGILILYVPFGKYLFEQLAVGFNKIISYSDAGSSFLFGPLVGNKMNTVFDGAGFIFAFKVLPTIIFVTALITILYYLKIMNVFIRILGGAFQKILNISKVESFAAVTTIFIGQNELPAALRPFLLKMNKNELFTVMCSGMAAVSGSVLVGYAGLGVPMTYLLAASLMAIPGGILFARLLSPATEVSQVEVKDISFGEHKPTNIIEAAASGAMLGLKIAAGVGTVIMVFVGLLALLNGLVGGIGGLFGFSDLSINSIFGYILSPLAYLMGVDWNDASLAGALLGQKLAINEFVAYLGLAPHLADHSISPHTAAIISFGLCGFANFSSIGIVIGAFSVVEPSLTPVLSKLAMRALLAATLSNLMSATIAGICLSFTM